MARSGWARQGLAVLEWIGKEWPGLDCYGRSWQSRPSEAGNGLAGMGLEWQSWKGLACLGEASTGKAVPVGPGMVGHVEDGYGSPGLAGTGCLRMGMAGQARPWPSRRSERMPMMSDARQHGEGGEHEVPRPTISVLMPAYNCGLYIREALESLLAQTFTDWEAVIVDDASTDQTSRAAYAFMAAHPERRIALVNQYPHGGCCVTTVAAIQHASADILTVLDADDWLLPHSLDLIVGAFENHKDVGFLWTRWRHSSMRWRCWARDLPKGQTLRQALETGWWAASCQRAFRKSSYEKTIGLDPSLTLAVDLQLAAIMGAADVPCLSVDNVSYVYRDHGTQSSKIRHAEQQRCHREIIRRLKAGELNP